MWTNLEEAYESHLSSSNEFHGLWDICEPHRFLESMGTIYTERDSERKAEGIRVLSREEAAPSCFSSLEGQGALGVQLLLFQGFIYLFVLPTYGG